MSEVNSYRRLATAAFGRMPNIAEAHSRLREDNHVENSHLPIRKHERHMQQFKSQALAQRFLNVHGAVYNTFYTQRHLGSRQTMKLFRAAAHQAWKVAAA